MEIKICLWACTVNDGIRDAVPERFINNYCERGSKDNALIVCDWTGSFPLFDLPLIIP